MHLRPVLGTAALCAFWIFVILSGWPSAVFAAALIFVPYFAEMPQVRCAAGGLATGLAVVAVLCAAIPGAAFRKTWGYALLSACAALLFVAFTVWFGITSGRLLGALVGAAHGHLTPQVIGGAWKSVFGDAGPQFFFAAGSAATLVACAGSLSRRSAAGAAMAAAGILLAAVFLYPSLRERFERPYAPRTSARAATPDAVK